MTKRIKDLTLKEIIEIHTNTPCHECPLIDENGICIRYPKQFYDFSEEFLNREVKVEK